MATLTLAQIRTLVSHATGVSIGDGKRHTPTVVDQYVNDALEQYHNELTSSGHPQRVKRANLSTVVSTATGEHGWPANEVVALPEDFLSLLSVFEATGGNLRQLHPFTQADRDKENSNETGRPRLYGIAHSEGYKLLKVWPAANAVYSIQIEYLPTATGLTEDEDEVEFFPGTQDVVICPAAMRVLEADGIPESAQYQSISQRYSRALGTLTRFASRANRAGPKQMVNVGSIRERNRIRGYYEDLD